MSTDQEKKDELLRTTLHDRAREASVEQRKLLISLAAGGIGAYFLGLTVKIEPQLLVTQKWVLCGGATLFFGAILFGIFAWQADAQRNYLWAKALDSNDQDKRKPLIKQKNAWGGKMETSMRLLRYSFVGGVLAGVSYVVLRIFDI